MGGMGKNDGAQGAMGGGAVSPDTALEAENARLRADLATAKADELLYIANVTRLEEDCERWLKESEEERLAHAETRKALDAWTQNGFGARTPAEVQVYIEEGCRVEREIAEHNAKLLESTRAELASWRRTAEKLEARVQDLEHRCLDAWNIMHNLSASENLDGSERVVVERWLTDNG